MKKILTLLLIFISYNTCSATNPNLFRLAVFNLKSKTVPDTLIHILEDNIKDELKTTGLFSIIPYQDIKIAKKNTTLFDRGNARAYLKIGRRVAADKILYGSIEEKNRIYKLQIYIMDSETRKIDRDITVFKVADADSISALAPAVLWKFYYPDNDTGYTDKSITFKNTKLDNKKTIYKVSTPIFMMTGIFAAVIGKRVVSSDFDETSTDSIEFKYKNEKISNNRAVFDLTGFSAKATAMAEAYTAIGGGPAGFVYNPATLPFIESRSAGTSFLQYTGFNDDYSLRTISFAYSDRINENNYFGNALFYTGGDGLMDELTFLTGYGIAFKDVWKLPNFTLGGNFKFRSLRFGEGENSYGKDRVRGNAWGIGFDIGGTAKFTKELTGGMALSDVFNYLRWNNSLTDKSYNEPLPRELKMGLAYRYNTFLLFSMDWFKSIYSNQSEAFSFGFNWEPLSFLAFRGGWFQDAYQYDRSKLTGGVGIEHLFQISSYGKYNVRIDYSFEYFSLLYNRHNFSLSIEF